MDNLLLAEPFLDDLYFKRSVVLLAQHSMEEGSVGFILNKPTDLNVDEVIPDFPDFDAPIFSGGPVEQDRLNYLHILGDKLEDSIEILPGLFWGGDFDQLAFLVDTKQITSAQIRFFLGYSGWEPLQLEREIREKSWFTTQASLKWVFHDKSRELWRLVLRTMGDSYAIIANFPDDPSLN